MVDIKSGDIGALKELRLKYPKNIIIGSLNINSLPNKLDALKVIVQSSIDVLVIVETKTDDSFPKDQLCIEGFSAPYRLDRNRHGGGVMIYVRDDIPTRPLMKHKFSANIESLFIEVNLRKNKFLLGGTYHSRHEDYGTTDLTYFEQMSLALDSYCEYDKFLLAGDFNVQEEEACLDDFLDQFSAKNMVKEDTCFKSVDNPSCIDLLITNSPNSFQNTITISTGLSDFHKMTATVMKTTFEKQKPKIIMYRDFSKFSKETFTSELKNCLDDKGINEYNKFEEVFLSVLDKHAPHKKKTVRFNHKPFVTKELRKAIMRRSSLKNKFYHSRTDENKQEYLKQKNFCDRLSKRIKSDYYSNLDMKNLTDNKKFWKTVGPLFSNKGGMKNNITLVDKGNISNDAEIDQSFNNYFDNSVKSLNTSENKLLSDTKGTDNPVDTAIKKLKGNLNLRYSSLGMVDRLYF